MASIDHPAASCVSDHAHGVITLSLLCGRDGRVRTGVAYCSLPAPALVGMLVPSDTGSSTSS